MIRRMTFAGLCAIVVLLPATSCVTITNDPDEDGGGTIIPDVVTVRLINVTPDHAVDVQLYATGQAVSNLDTEFFVPANQKIAGIGFAGSGILTAGSPDEVQIPCQEGLIIGTLGGRFLDQETGAEVGTGNRYVLFMGSQYACGGTITFAYTSAGNGFVTGLNIDPPGQ